MVNVGPTYGEQLRRWLEARQLSVSALSIMTGLSRETIYRLLNGVSKPRGTTHKLICDALGIKPADFFAPLPATIDSEADTPVSTGTSA